MTLTTNMPITKVHAVDTADVVGANATVVVASGNLVIDDVDFGPIANLKTGSRKAQHNPAVAGVKGVVSVTSVAGNRLTVMVEQPVKNPEGASQTTYKDRFTITESGTPGTDMAALKVLIDASLVANGGRLAMAVGVLSTTTVANDTLTYTASAGSEVLKLKVDYLEDGSSATLTAGTQGEWEYYTTDEVDNFYGFDTSGYTATDFSAYFFNNGINTGRNGVTELDPIFNCVVFYDSGAAGVAAFETDMDAVLP